jgi:hypothetical protein
MKCIKCDKDAKAICQFCGRAVCEDHIQTKRFVSGYSSVGSAWNLTANAISVDDAVWCEICHPEYHDTK